ncbi:MAG: hypothetical protein VXY99_16315 [Pseudomonadota bacterium]|nr:hypothetical protein [Pseudomonadota bacterium]MEC7418621.1 hypothetical protein [Pseudomonadota bacterium]MEC8485382.1 hypothetical protein [Pseudomonadota bacterium]
MTDAHNNKVHLCKRDYIALVSVGFTVFLTVVTGYAKLTAALQTLETGQAYQTARLDQLQSDVTRVEDLLYEGNK